MSATARAFWESPEMRAKQSAAHRGKKHSPEACAKMSAAARAAWATPETREKISAGQRRRRLTAKKACSSLYRETDSISGLRP